VVAWVVMTVKTEAGDIRLAVDPPAAEVDAEGGRITISRAREGQPYTITVAEGRGKLVIRKTGCQVESRDVALSDHGRTLARKLKREVARGGPPSVDPSKVMSAPRGPGRGGPANPGATGPAEPTPVG